MAIYNGLLKIKGKVGKHSFYKNRNGEKVIREGWGPDRERIETDPAFAHIKTHQSEFKNSTAACKLFRRSFLDFVKDAADNRVTSRITKFMSQIKNLDPSARGERTVDKGLKVKGSEKLVTGFNFNVKAKLDTVLLAKPEVDLQNNSLTFKPFNSPDDIKFPDGATHACLDMAVGIFNFKKGTCEFYQSESEVLEINENRKSLKIRINKKPKTKGWKVMVLRVGFLQEFNGMQYMLSNAKKNVAEVISVGWQK